MLPTDDADPRVAGAANSGLPPKSDPVPAITTCAVSFAGLVCSGVFAAHVNRRARKDAASRGCELHDGGARGRLETGGWLFLHRVVPLSLLVRWSRSTPWHVSVCGVAWQSEERGAEADRHKSGESVEMMRVLRPGPSWPNYSKFRKRGMVIVCLRNIRTTLRARGGLFSREPAIDPSGTGRPDVRGGVPVNQSTGNRVDLVCLGYSSLEGTPPQSIQSADSGSIHLLGIEHNLLPYNSVS